MHPIAEVLDTMPDFGPPGISCLRSPDQFPRLCILEKWRIVRKYKMIVVNRMNL